MRRLLLAITLAVAFLAVAYTMTGALAAPRGNPRQPAGESSSVIRFVKDPQDGPSLARPRYFRRGGVQSQLERQSRPGEFLGYLVSSLPRGSSRN